MSPKETPVKSPAPKRVGIWIRVSTEDQARGESPKHHEERARLYAASRGWTVVELYDLAGISGKTVMPHPEAQRMLKDIERGHISALIFSKLARLGRNTRELLDFSEYFQKHGADLVSLQEAIDTSTPAGRLFYTMIAAMAHWEREEISSRVAASVPIRARLGKPLGGQAPYGYQWVDKKLEIHPEGAPVRKLIHELFADLKRKKTVARKLNEMGYRTRSGKPWSGSTIGILIQDPSAKGLRRTNYLTHGGPNGKSMTRKPESEWIHVPCEPIVSEELWDRCHAILLEQAVRRTPKARRAVQLFGGLTWCGCGGKMYVKSNTPKYVCRDCNHKIPVIELEEIFVEELKNYFFSAEEIGRYLEDADRTIQAKSELIGVLEQERVTVRKEMDRIFQLLMNERITEEGFGDRYRPHEIRLAQINEELPRLQAELDLLRVNLMSGDEILHQARDLYSRWPSMTHDQKRRIVEAITERIVIGKEEIEIDLFYLPGMMKDAQASVLEPEDSEPPDDEPKRPSSSPADSMENTTPMKSKARAFAEIVATGQTTVRDC